MTKLLRLLFFILLLAACDPEPAPTPAPDGPPIVYTTFHPTTYFVERLAGDFVEVVCPLPADEDPIFWQPSRDVLAAYQSADLIVLNGAEFEKWPAQASLPVSRTVDSVAELTDELLTYAASTAHRHGMAGEHTHEGVDGHTWVDPLTAKEQVATLAKALSTRWPDHARTIEENRLALARDLDVLDARLRALAPRLADVRILCSHPAYNYLARRQGWQVTNFDLDPEAPPTEEQLTAIGTAVEGSARTVLLWEAAPLPSTESLLRDRLSLPCVLFSPAETVAAGGANYLLVMGANIDRLEAAVAQPGD